MTSSTLQPPPPKFGRGTSPGRHPWFLKEGGPPDFIPPGIIVHGMGHGDSDESHCPRCNYPKAAICQCGYDWDNLVWL